MPPGRVNPNSWPREATWTLGWGAGRPKPKAGRRGNPAPFWKGMAPLPQGMAALQGTEAEQRPLSGSETSGRGKALLVLTPRHVPRTTLSVTHPRRLPD